MRVPIARSVPAIIATQKWNHPCELVLRARLVPDLAGADTQVIAHVPLSQLLGAPDVETPGSARSLARTAT